MIGRPDDEGPVEGTPESDAPFPSPYMSPDHPDVCPAAKAKAERDIEEALRRPESYPRAVREAADRKLRDLNAQVERENRKNERRLRWEARSSGGRVWYVFCYVCLCLLAVHSLLIASVLISRVVGPYLKWLLGV